MKFLVHISRVIVGVVFILSGFVKLTDPLGFSYKLEEYFGADVLALEFLIPFALVIAMSVVIFEFVLGAMLLLGHKPKFTVWSLLLMIVFFTFLTFYSAFFDKVTDCGCFGDAVKLTPWQSFTKDIVLLLLIAILFIGRKHIKPLFADKIVVIGSVLALVGSTAYTMYMFNHLPAIDFRPYKIGNNIIEQMTVPEDAPQAIFDYHWRFNVDGEDKIITTRGSYPSSDGTFVEVDTELVQAGYEPPVHDFTMELDGVDETLALMSEENLIIVHSFNILKSDRKGFERVKPKVKEAREKGYMVIGMTASGAEEIEPLKQELDLDFDFYFCDETTLKTMIRSNPGILKLSKGTIQQKLHYRDVDELLLEKVGAPIEKKTLQVEQGIDSISPID